MKKSLGVAIVFILFSAELVLFSRISTGWFAASAVLALILSIVAIAVTWKKEKGYE